MIFLASKGAKPFCCHEEAGLCRLRHGACQGAVPVRGRSSDQLGAGRQQRCDEPVAAELLHHAVDARVKDALETHLHFLVCQGELTLAEAQKEISNNWIAAYQKRREEIALALERGLYTIKPPEK